MRKPLGIIFDFSDTVLRFQSYSHAAGCEKILEYAAGTKGLTQQEVVQISEKMANELFPMGDRADIQYKHTDFIRLICDYSGISLTISYPEAERKWWQGAIKYVPAEGIFDLLNFLDANGIKTGILSNSSFSGETLNEELASHKLAHRFSFLISSADYGIRKPNPFIFQLAAKMMGLDPQNIWFAGDSLDYDVAGAVSSNLCPVWYNCRGEIPNKRYDCPEVKSWLEFTHMVRSSCSS